MHCPAGYATDPIWRVLASSLGISSWTALKPQHSNSNPNPLAYQLWCIDFLTPPTPLRHPSQSPCLPLNLLCHSKTDTRFMQNGRKAVWSIPYVSVAFSLCLKQNFIAYCSSISVLTSRLHFWNSPGMTLRLLVTENMTEMGIKIVPYRPYSPDLALPVTFGYSLSSEAVVWDNWWDERGLWREVIDTLTQGDFYGAFQKLLERYKYIAARGD